MHSLGRRAPERIEALTDLVFGLALAIGAIQLTLHPSTSAAGVLSNVLEFAASFAVLVWAWVTYSRLVARPEVESPRLLALNVGLLLVVTLEPYLLHILWIGVVVGTDELVLNLSSVAYALDLALLFGFLGWMTRLLAAHPDAGLPSKSRDYHLHLGGARMVFGAMFAVTLLPVFWTVAVPMGGTQFGVEPLVLRGRYVAGVASAFVGSLPPLRSPAVEPSSPETPDSRPSGRGAGGHD